MSGRWISTVLFLLAQGVLSPGSAQVLVKRYMTLMGSQFDISVVAGDSAKANTEIDRAVSEIRRIENLISEWLPESQVSEINRNAGVIPVKVDREVFELARRAVRYAAMTDGAFDVSIAAMDKLWRYDGSMTVLPDSVAVRKSIEKVGYRDILLDEARLTVYLRRPGMKIGFGSIGKGYAADKCRELLQAGGVAGGIVNASGDLSAWGGTTSGKAWKIGITDPLRPRKMVKILKVRTGAVATSGNYEKYAEIDGKRYSHIIDPKTGYPSAGLTSVTITGPSAEFANFLSTSVMVAGIGEGRKLMRRFPAYKYLLLTDSGRVVQSRNLR